MESLLHRVKSRLFIAARRHAFHQLDGQYRSRARGRGMDFDDLREYIPGDDVRDIDWNATARSPSTLVRRYRTERKQLVTFVVNGGRSMSAITRRDESKREVAVFCLGVMAYLSSKHGDDVALLLGDADSAVRIPAGTSDAHLERLLRASQNAMIADAAASDMAAMLERAARTLTRRMILVCISDEAPFTPAMEQTLTALAARHEVLWVSIGDSALDGPARTRPVHEVSLGRMIPPYLVRSNAIRAEASAIRLQHGLARATALDRLGISHTLVHAIDEVLPALTAMYSRRGYARG